MKDSFLVSLDRHRMLVLIADKLMGITRHPSVVSEAALYGLENDIPYIADILQTSLARCVDFNTPDYCLEYVGKPIPPDINPVRAQSIADKIVVSLATIGRVPEGYTEWKAIRLGKLLYEVGSWQHPNTSIRYALARMSQDLPVWVKVLPHFKKEISLLI